MRRPVLLSVQSPYYRKNVISVVSLEPMFSMISIAKSMKVRHNVSSRTCLLSEGDFMNSVFSEPEDSAIMLYADGDYKAAFMRRKRYYSTGIFFFENSGTAEAVIEEKTRLHVYQPLLVL